VAGALTYALGMRLTAVLLLVVACKATNPEVEIAQQRATAATAAYERAKKDATDAMDAIDRSTRAIEEARAVLDAANLAKVRASLDDATARAAEAKAFMARAARELYVRPPQRCIDNPLAKGCD